MAEHNFVHTTYSIETSSLPLESFELLAFMEAQYLQLRGFIQQTSDSTYKGVLEGDCDTVMQLLKLLATAEQFNVLIKKLEYTEPTPITELTQEPFSIMTKSDGKLWRSEFKINGRDLSDAFFEVYACKRAQDLKLHGHMQSTSKERFTGVVEGRKEALERLKRSLTENDDYKKKIQNYSFTKPHVITHYTEDSFVVKTYEKQLFYCDFEIYAKSMPRELYEKFIEKKALNAGARGTIESREDGLFQGRLEGERLAIESIQEVLSNADPYVLYIDKCIFSELKSLDKFTTEKFSSITFNKSKKLYSCKVTINAPDISKDVFYILADAHNELWNLHGKLQHVENGVFEGIVEGEVEVLESLKEVMNLMCKIAPIESVTFGSNELIQNYTSSQFKIKM